MRGFVASAAALLFSAALAGGAAAQTEGQRTACTRDVTRHCRSVMNDGDSAVLACLQQNRAKLGKACQKTLTDNGQ